MFTLSSFYIFSLTFVILPVLCIENPSVSDQILIENGYVTCYSDRLIIHLYYFPYGDKTIKYNDIRSCQFLAHNELSMFETKCWGMALSPVWWHADFSRSWRQYFLILDANQWPKIGLTMDDNDTIQLYLLIKSKIDLNSSEKSSHTETKHDSNSL